jgi:hypothetical protein
LLLFAYLDGNNLSPFDVAVKYETESDVGEYMAEATKNVAGALVDSTHYVTGVMPSPVISRLRGHIEKMKRNLSGAIEKKVNQEQITAFVHNED